VASTVRLGAGVIARSPHVTIVAVGSFGEAVANAMQSFYRGTQALSDLGKRWMPSTDEFVIAAMCSEDHDLCDRIDQQARLGGSGWLPVFIDHPLLQVGPLILPDRPGCYCCFLRRRAQHESRARRNSGPREGRARSAGGTEGFFHHHASIAAAMAWELMTHGKDDGGIAGPGPGPAGLVLAWNVRNGSGHSDRLVGCHGCPRCREPSGGREVLRDGVSAAGHCASRAG
jgi:bacteriocin biosynthesis cyclodehydratase domain-containing protein